MTRLETLSNRMEALARYAVPSANYSKELADEYYEVREMWLEEKERLNKELDNLVSKKEAQELYITFVNSFGEATKREITSRTYKQACKRTEHDVLRNLGR